MRRRLLIALVRLAADVPLAWMLLFLHFQGGGDGGLADASFNGAVFLLFAVTHSILARPGPKQALAARVGADYVRPVYVVISGLSLAGLLLLWRPLAGSLWRIQGPWSFLPTLLFVAAVGGLVWAASFIDYAQFLGIRSLLRSARGRPSKPPVFSARGPYAHCRHPMYAFLILALWIGPAMPFGRLEFAVLASGYLLVGTLFEERNLRVELGHDYERYQAQVPMWLPRLSPWRPGVSRELGDPSQR